MFLWYSLLHDSANLSAYGYPSWLDMASQKTKLNKNIITLRLPYPFMYRTFKAWRISTGVVLSCFGTHWLRGVICWGMELSQGKSLPWKVNLFWIPLSKNAHQTDENSSFHLFGNSSDSAIECYRVFLPSCDVFGSAAHSYFLGPNSQCTTKGALCNCDSVWAERWGFIMESKW